VGLRFGATISNTSHSNKAGSTTVKRAWLTGKGSRLMAVATISIKNFPISLHVMYLYFPAMPHNIIESTYIFALLIMNSRFMKYHIKV
jgi:hypothetical protein